MSDDLKIAPDAPMSMVEWRVDGRPYNNRARFVPYLDARDCAKLMDEWVGPANWSDDYEQDTVADKPVLWCLLSVRVDETWVTKRDLGVPSNFEAAKGLVSDAFKRCAMTKWGVGRNVYDLPGDVWAPCDVRQDRGGNDQVYPNAASLAAIQGELTKRGFDVDGGKVAAEPESQEEPVKTPLERVLTLAAEYGQDAVRGEANKMRTEPGFKKTGTFTLTEQISAAPEKFIAEIERRFANQNWSEQGPSEQTSATTQPAQSAGSDSSAASSSEPEPKDGAVKPETVAKRSGPSPSSPQRPCPNCGTECIETPASSTKWACPTGDWESYHTEPWKEGGEVEKILRVKSYTPEQKKLYDTMRDFGAQDAIKAVTGIEDRAQLERVRLVESDGRARKAVLAAIGKQLESEQTTGGDNEW